MAGSGKGREALNEVIEAIQLHAYKDAEALHAFGEAHDMRTALVLSPLAYVWRDRPRLVAMEQVPTVLPVWEACAEVMREWGYKVKVETLNAEQYGVPQTRKRAILVARRGGPVHLPQATHSRYYSRTPKKLDKGVQKWVSMAEALGWTPEESEGSTYTGNNKLAHQAVRTLDQPAPTVTAGHDSGNRGFIDCDGQFFKATVEQVSALQSYPTGRGLIDRPSPTITGGGTETGEAEPIAKYHERYTSAPGWVGSTARLSLAEVAALQTYPPGIYVHPMTNGRRGIWPTDEPAPTVRGVNRPMPETYRLHERDACDPAEAHTRLSVEESAVLQTYERPFVWCGAQGKQFLQIGNAVPPLLAEHVLAALIGITPGR
jgi:DNA (cytosine-5)-methyltransferase 1